MLRLLPALSLLLVSSSAVAVEAGDEAPAWSGTDLAGQQITFPSSAERRTSVLVIWATWCPYCRVLMPYLDEIQREYRDQGVQVLAINAKEDGDPQAYMKQHDFAFPSVLDGDSIAEAYAVQYLPGLFVIDADGVVVYRRGWTDLPAGQEVAELWDRQVREVLESLL